MNSGLVVTVQATSETQAPAEAFVETQRIFRELATSPARATTPILVVVDNIDRLAADDALFALREIRSLVEVPESRTVFLVPLDRGVLIRQLGKELGGSQPARDFLDKFFNVDIPLTDPEPVDLRSWIRDVASQVFEGDDREPDELAALAQVVALAAGRSPRAAKRILNGVYARQRLVEDAARDRLKLPPIAIVEALLIRIPDSIKVLLEAPRQFVDVRLRIREGEKSPRDDDFITRLAGDAASEIRRFLFATREIELTLSDLQDLLSLRQERTWRDIADGGATIAALEAGDGVRLVEVLHGLDENRRAPVISRSIEWGRKSFEDGYPLSAFNALNAVAEAIALAPSEEASAQSFASDLLRNTPIEEVLARITPETVELLGRSGSRLGQTVWTSALAALTPELPEAAQRAGVRMLKATSRHATSETRRAAQARIANYGNSTLEPLFEPPVLSELIDADVGNRYAADLAQLDLTEEGVSRATISAERLALAQAHGWKGTTQVGAIVTRLATQVAAVKDFTPGVEHLVEELTKTTSAYSGATISELVTALAAWAGPRREATLALALRHNPKDVSAATKGQVESWLTTADPAAIASLATRTEAAPSRAAIDAAGVLASRWLKDGDEAVATLSTEFEVPAQRGHSLVAGVRDAPATTALPRISQLLGLARANGFAIDAGLVGAAAKHLESLPASEVPALIGVTEHLGNAGCDLAPLADAYLTRLAAVPRVELLAFADLGRHLAGLVPARRRDMTAAYVKKSAGVGHIPLLALRWLTEEGAGADVDVALGTLGAAIRRGDYAAADLTRELTGVREGLRSDSSIRAALATFAAKASTDCETARVLLAEAQFWHQCIGEELDELDRSLAAMSERCPALGDAIAGLRAVRRQDGDVPGDDSATGDSEPSPS